MQTVRLKELKISILALVEADAPIDAEMNARVRFCGGKYDIDKVIAKGLHVLSSEEQGKVLGLFVNSQSTQSEVRFHFGPTGYLRDVRFYSLDVNAEITSIRSRDPGNQQLLALANETLPECMIDPAPGTALEDFESLRDNYEVNEKHKSESWESQLCIIWHGRLGHWMNAHHPTAARFIMAAARHPSFCFSGMNMAKAAFHAKELQMEGEFWVIFKAALKLDADDAEPDYWNWLGCILDKIGQFGLSVACFLKAIELAPDWELARKNAWLVGQKLIKKMLKDKDFKGSLEEIDSLMTHHEGVEAEGRAFMMAATGLCCEGLGLLEEAGQRYVMAQDIMEACLVAKFGANRVTSENAQQRLRLFELQLESFPRIPHELGIENMAPFEFIAGYPHGDHWESVSSGAPDFIRNYLPLVVEKGELSGKAEYEAASRAICRADSVVMLSYPNSGRIHGGALLAKPPSSPNFEVWSAYPFVPQGESVRLEVSSLEEWSDGTEGAVVARRGGGGALTFFDPFFFKNKHYLKDHEYEFVLSGFAYSIKKTEPIVYKMSSGSGYEMERLRRQEEGRPMDEGETFDVVVGERSTLLSDLPKYPGEYQFFLPVEGIEQTDFLGEEVLVIKSHLNDDKRDIPFKIFTAKRLLKETDLAPGDLISGLLWMQGYLLSPEGIPVVSETIQHDDLQFGKINFKKQESESLEEEFEYVFSQALSTVDEVSSFAEMSFKVGDEPGYVVESNRGARVFVCGVYFDMATDTWEEQSAKAQQAAEVPWVLSRFSPFFILGIGYTKVGEGNAFTYFGWEEFEEALADD